MEASGVHDGGGAKASAWEHGRDDGLIKKTINREALRFRLKVEDDTFVADAISAEWLQSAILSVANASAIAAAEEALTEKIYAALKKVYDDWPQNLNQWNLPS